LPSSSTPPYRLPVKNSQSFLTKNILKVKIIIMTRYGYTRDRTDITAEVIVSKILIEELAVPKVKMVEALLALAVLNFTAEAVPPPAIILKMMRSSGVISPIKEAVMTVPATNAAGPSILSRRLSKPGIK
jgi:hypothetical protein